jgi:hypothetical protein
VVHWRHTFWKHYFPSSRIPCAREIWFLVI